jgi:alanyl-tRNA synthetase
LKSAKSVLRKRFSDDYEKYYRVRLFDEKGYVRKKCPSCQGYFWTLDSSREKCGEQPCEEYTFIGNPPTFSKLDYVGAWEKISKFFHSNGHEILSRYPVVCRWRPDLYFTIASIVDFQRIEAGKVIFEFPANPLLVPQMCLRFSDIENVGITGRHYTSFCMVGQHAIANSQGYWKDRCIELDFELLSSVFGIDQEKIVFKEDVWLGPGAFGYSLEYCVMGLELGNAVFTAYEGTPEHYGEYNEKIVDMGAGLERFAWISQGTSNSYDAVFGKVLTNIRDSIDIDLPDEGFLQRYFRFAGTLDAEEFSRGLEMVAKSFSERLGVTQEEFRRKASALRALYSIADHCRSLSFAISDGALPSNVGGGYNLRVILRRAIDFADDLSLQVPLYEIASFHADHLRGIFPELKERLGDIEEVISSEEQKYGQTRERTSKIVESLVKRKEEITTQKMVELYDSDGITPGSLVKEGLVSDVPPDFYSIVTARHLSQKQIVEESNSTTQLELGHYEPTKLLFYLDRDLFKFEARVLGVMNGKFVILDETAFYARSGGQEPDRGRIGEYAVIDVTKQQGVVLHEVSVSPVSLKAGDLVHCEVDSERRSRIMRHHTATHIVNGAARKVLGSWVWQHSAFKDVDMARLDITHFARLKREQAIEIERLANEIVRRDMPVNIKWLPRTEAEQSFGFRIYQGGAAPTKELRIVDISGWDIEACGGTHCSRTGEVGLIKIIKTERVQDGIERIEFAAGAAALELVERQESSLLASASALETTQDNLSSAINNLKQSEESYRKLAKQLSLKLAEATIQEAKNITIPIAEGVGLLLSPTLSQGLDSEYHIAVGQRLARTEPGIVYVGIFSEKDRTRIVVFSGETAQSRGLKAGEIARELSKSLGGSGGGDPSFGQGGVQRVISSESELTNLADLLRKKITQS